MKMKKNKSRRGLAIKIAVGFFALLLIVFGGFFLAMQNETSKMNPLDTGEVIPGIYAVNNGFVNFYLLEVNGRGNYIAIDAGSDASASKDELSRLGISSDDVIAVFLTHTHGDHVGALSLFDKADVYAGANSTYNKVSKKIADGETADLGGFSIQCIFAPGHADDSVCYLIDGKYLFSGDTLSLRDGKVGLFNSTFNKSDEVQKADIQKLSGISGIRYVFSAHYGFTDEAVFP